MNAPAVSIIIPTYNRASTLPRAIESVRAQTTSGWELIVVDDGSTDSTPEVLEGYAARLGDRLKLIRQHNCGCSAARNRGMEYARGEFIAFLDSDDEFLPHKLARQRELFSSYPQLDFVYSDYSFVDLQGQCTSSAFDAKFPIARSVPCNKGVNGLHVAGPELFSTLLQGYFIATIVGMVRRDSLGNTRFDSSLSYAEEWLFFLQLARTRRGGFVDEPLALHHFTEGSLTRSNKGRNLSRQCQLFHAMAAQFPDLCESDTRTVTQHLSRSYGQLARHCQKAGSRTKALIHSARSHYYRRKAGFGAHQVDTAMAR